MENKQVKWTVHMHHTLCTCAVTLLHHTTHIAPHITSAPHITHCTLSCACTYSTHTHKQMDGCTHAHTLTRGGVSSLY